jgi:perosamine synthetase
MDKPSSKTPLTNPSKYFGNELDYLAKVLNSESWSATGGSWTQTLEQNFSKKFGRHYGIAFNSGTSTLHAALEAVGVGSGDEVISPALTVIMDTTATLHANAIPVYADVDPDTFNIDPVDLARKITPRTKAIIVVALYGLAPDMDPIMEIAREHQIPVIEDNAQAMLGTYKGKLLGTFGEFSSFSFENTKHLSCGEGGILICDDAQLAESARKIGGHGFKNLQAAEGRIRLNEDIFQHPDYKRHDVLGWNYRLSEFNAAVALAQLERVQELIDLRIKCAQLFMDVMKTCDYLIPQKLLENCINPYYTLGVCYEGEQSIGISWEDFRSAYVKESGDGIYGSWSVPYLEPMMAERRFVKRCPSIYKDIYYERGLCPIAERVQKKLMQFKTNYRDFHLVESKADALYQVIKKFTPKV